MKIGSSGDTIDGYLAVPPASVAGEGPWPGVVIVHDLLGLSDDIRSIAERFATAGYLAVVPNLYDRGAFVRCVRAVMGSLRAGKGQAFADIEAARALLAERSDCTGKIGVVGFCMGGGFALLTAPRGFDVAAANYGQAPSHASEVFREACPIVASYGGRDPLMAGQAKRVEKALTTSGATHDFKVYPGAGHSFLNDEMVGPRALQPIERVLNVGPRPEAAQDAWARIDAYFDTYLR